MNNKGITPVISYVLLVGIVVITTSAAYFWAYPHIDRLGEGPKAQNMVNQMESLDYAMRQTIHGEIGFRNSFNLHIPEGSIRLEEDNDKIIFNFQQGTAVIGYIPEPNDIETPINCTEDLEYILDERTNIIGSKIGEYSQLYAGSTGAPGTAILTLCYPNVELVWQGKCIRGRGGPRTNVLMEKKGINEEGKPVISIDFC